MKGNYCPGQIFLSDLFNCFTVLPKEKSVEDYLLECVLRGSGFQGGKERFFEIVNSDLSVTEQTVKIKNEYGIGGSFFACMHRGEPCVLTGYSSDAKGLRIRYQDENVEEKEYVFSWSQVRNAIEEQIRKGTYLDSSDNKSVERKFA
jgi:hypothetical protein